MKHENKKIGRTGLKWVYQEQAQAELVAMAMLGQSNWAIRQALEFTDHEINYALHKAKLLYKLPHSLRQGWRDGDSDVARQVKADLVAVIAQDVQSQLPKLIVHPTAQTTTEVNDDATHRSKKSFYSRTDRSGIPAGGHGPGGSPKG